MRRKISLLLCLVILLLSVFFAIPAFADAPSYDIVRVKLSIGNTTSLPFFVDGNYTVAEDDTLTLKRQLYTVKLEEGVLNVYNGFETEGPIYSGASFTLIQHSATEGRNNFIFLENAVHGHRGYLGDLHFSIYGDYIRLINYVYMAEYLYGVVPYEMSNSWPLEALKTQAVAARTYVSRYIEQQEPNYEVVDTAANQVYKGYNAAYENAISAVEGTGKTVLTCDGELVPTYYSASNGGQIDIPQHVWSVTDPIMPYHVIKDDPYDTQNPWSIQEVLIFPKAITDTAQIDYKFMSSGSMISGENGEKENAERYLKIACLPKVAEKGYIAAVSSDVKITAINSITPHTYEGQHGDVLDYNGENACRAYTHSDVNMTVMASKYVTNPGPVVMLGDCNNDETINISDYTLIRLDILSLKALSEQARLAADINKDGEINISDYTLVRLDILGLKEIIQDVASEPQLIEEPVTVQFTIDMHEFDKTDGLYQAFTKNLRLFAVEETETSWNLYHRRYGHGLGMSQRGAQQMAKTINPETITTDTPEGRFFTYDEIVEFYYPNTTLEALSITKPELTPIPDVPDECNAVINCDASMNVRSTPDTNNDPLGELPNGARVKVTQVLATPDWHKIEYGGQVAYLYKDYVDLLIQSDVYTIDRVQSLLQNVPQNTAPAQLISNLKVAGGTVTVHNADGTEFTGASVASGMIIKLTVDNKVNDQLEIAVITP